MRISYSNHARKRMRERGISELEVEHILMHPTSARKAGMRRIISGELERRHISIVVEQRENYIKIITVM